MAIHTRRFILYRYLTGFTFPLLMQLRSETYNRTNRQGVRKPLGRPRSPVADEQRSLLQVSRTVEYTIAGVIFQSGRKIEMIGDIIWRGQNVWCNVRSGKREH
jgi:hypothetical protein